MIEEDTAPTIDANGWAIVWEDDDLIIFPAADTMEHDTTSGIECACDPDLEVENGALIFVHQALDGRE